MLAPIALEYTGADEAVEGVLSAVGYVVGILAEILGIPVEDNIHLVRYRLQLSPGYPFDFVGLLLLDLGVAGPVALGAGEDGVEVGQFAGDRDCLALVLALAIH
jgi:hypothetical protein